MGMQSSVSTSQYKKAIKFIWIAVAIISIAGILWKMRSTESATDQTPSSRSRLGVFQTAAVATDGVPCSKIGRDVLSDGGSAVDAAIAALFCIGVVHPHSAGIGGGFLMTIYDAKTGKAECLNAREVAPLAATENMFGGNASASRKGALAVAVPGEVAGYWEAHQRYGRLPWARLVLPSVRLASKGLPINSDLARILRQEEENIKEEPSLWEFLDQTTKKVLEDGDILIRPAFAETLRIIAHRGVDVLYNGVLGDRIVADIRERGGIVVKEDLENYRPQWMEPVRLELGGNLTLFSMPPPGSGVLVAFSLNILNNYGNRIRKNGNSREITKNPLVYHWIVEAFKHIYAQRAKLADPCCNATLMGEMAQLVKSLTTGDLARTIFLKIDDRKTENDPNFYGAVTYSPEDHGTSHVSILDGRGLAVSVTSTINLNLGARFVSTRTGIILNNQMDDFSSPDITNAYGIPPSKANFIRPGKRPLSSMSPTIIARSDNKRVRLIIGAAGGTKITTSVIYAIIRNLWFKENIKETIDSRRIHHQLFPMTFQYEDGLPLDIVKEMRTRGHNVSSYKTGSVMTGIHVAENGLIYANSDWRKTGDVAGID